MIDSCNPNILRLTFSFSQDVKTFVKFLILEIITSQSIDIFMQAVIDPFKQIFLNISE